MSACSRHFLIFAVVFLSTFTAVSPLRAEESDGAGNGLEQMPDSFSGGQSGQGLLPDNAGSVEGLTSTDGNEISDSSQQIAEELVRRRAQKQTPGQTQTKKAAPAPPRQALPPPRKKAGGMSSSDIAEF